MSEGQRLQATAPRGLGVTVTVQDWGTAVNTWVEQTRKLLESYSAQAAASFLYDVGGAGVIYHGIADPHNYALLVARLNNLRGVMEKPDVYF